MLEPQYDVVVMGGGLNGAAIARDAAGRGLSVLLCDEGDLGGGNSSATGKLAHGGLRYLDGLRLGAMREAVQERDILMHAAPHLLRPQCILIPHHFGRGERARLRVGLYALDHAARSRLHPSGAIDLAQPGAGVSLQSHYTTGFAHWDCLADDSRLVILNALDARSHGATVRPRLRCTLAERDRGRWRVALESTLTGEPSLTHAAVLVNATGAAAAEVHNHVVHSERPVSVRYIKSTYVAVRREEPDPCGYALMAGDGSIVYAMPWQRGTMLIGPCERDVPAGQPPESERRDLAWLADVVALYFEQPFGGRDIVWSSAAVTAMPAGSAQRSERAIVVDTAHRGAPLISVFGGTLVGHRRLAEQAMDAVGRFRKLAPSWTAGARLPGGGFPASGGGDLVRALLAAYPFLAENHAAGLVRAYGTRASSILTGARTAEDLGVRFGADLTEAEVGYLRSEEWALTAEDILWRRSKLGFVFSDAEAGALADWMAGSAHEAFA